MSDISIIVPIYNAEKYLEKCIDSLINQTLKNIEIILINDGSTDNSENIINKYDDKRIKYFKNKNQGIGKTRNFGIDKATGKYLMFVDSDDFIEIDACEILFKEAESNSLDLVICDFFKDYDNGTKEEIKIIDFDNCSLKDNPMLINNVNLAPWNKLYSKELIDDNKIRFIENLKYEDAPFVCSALKNAKKIGKVNQCLIDYVIHGNSETTVRDKRIFDIFEIIDIIRNDFKQDDYIKESLDMLTVRMITNYTIQQRYLDDKHLVQEFLDKAFSYLKENVPDYKDNKYYLDRGIIRRNIEKSKFLSSMYCKIYKG